MDNIQGIIGRQGKQEIVVASCENMYISLRGGYSSGFPDRVFIPSNVCGIHRNLAILLPSWTAVTNEGWSGHPGCVCNTSKLM